MSEPSVDEVMSGYPDFEESVPQELRWTNEQLHTLQVNLGYKCNLKCRHCHLQCGPDRTESMSREVMLACIDAYKTGGFTSMDITGGAPEAHPDYAWFLEKVHDAGIKPMCRTNLCILTEKDYTHFTKLYADYDVTLVASLPHFISRNCDKVRGDGVFNSSIEALRTLNKLGFGTGSHTIMLVYNPAKAVLPPDQASMEAEYKQRLESDFGVYFDTLIAIANNPSGRFAQALNDKGNLAKYMDKLVGAFNEATCEGMMCRDQISVDYTGRVYDCDFNQALDLPARGDLTIFDFVGTCQKARHIVFGNHCYGCTAGAGSSCGGATA